ncbi:unnamed protein product [Leptidea sinapis]|uniref:Uncharacterized protein n=1 Tax=Leptidea sinapis TaxID=189913 RepID=A0A5E4PXI3_9NEOP|nr:unnamed protein product [Leptidea sinapis]
MYLIAVTKKIFSSCKKRSSDFDGCVKRAFNKLRPFFKKGIPEMGVAPFDPHFAPEVKQTRSIAGMGYTLTLKNGGAFGLDVLRGGHWNLTLRDYSQTTRIKRNGSGVDVHVEIDHIGDMDIHISNLLRGRSIMESVLDRIINATWKPGFAVIRPLINDLVSTAFTDLWSKSFKDFPVDAFIQD